MKLTHPDSELTIDPKAEHADEYLSAGWVEAEEKPAAKPKGK